MRRALYTVLLAGLFLLMLSALVVTPEAIPDPTPTRAPADFHAMFRPLVSAILPEPAAAPVSRADVRVMLTFLPVLTLCLAFFTGTRDANGRVLRDIRYENSVYQLFRPEVAGG